LDEITSRITQLLDQLETVVIGKRAKTRFLLAALISGGHILMNDVPGVAKTRLVRALAALSSLSFARIQGTPDLLPTEVTGGMIYQPQSGSLEFRQGPVFHHLVLVDEINRATPRTQAALLECMEEHQVSADGQTHPLPNPFMVLATQNPIEMEGTFPLPEAQLDRFLLSFSLGYPTAEEEAEIAKKFSGNDPLATLEPVLHAEDLLALRSAAEQVLVNDPVLDYVVRLCRATRETSRIRLGASPRATIQFVRVLRSYALTAGRSYATPDDVKVLAPVVLAHRIVLGADAAVERLGPERVIQSLLDTVEVPVEII
jgi:MoxR-like ATPase